MSTLASVGCTKCSDGMLICTNLPQSKPLKNGNTVSANSPSLISNFRFEQYDNIDPSYTLEGKNYWWRESKQGCIQGGEMWDVNWNVGVGSIIFYIGDTNKQALHLNIRESVTIMNSYDERWGEENKSITQFHSAPRPLKFKISFNNKAGFNIIYQENLVGLFPNIFNISNSSNFKITTTSSQIKVIPESQLKSESSFEFIKNEINNQKSIINETSDQIEKKAEALEEKQKQVYGQTKEIEDKMRLLETRDKMRELSIDRNLYKNKVIYSLFSVVLAFVIIMIGLYALFNKKLNLGE